MNKLKFILRLAVILSGFLMSELLMALPEGWLMEQNDFNSYEAGSPVRDVYRFYQNGTDKKIQVRILPFDESKNFPEDYLSQLAQHYNCAFDPRNPVSDKSWGETQVTCQGETSSLLFIVKRGENWVLLIAGINTGYEEIDALLRDLKNANLQEN